MSKNIPPRHVRQRLADLRGRPERIQKLRMDLLADLEFYSEINSSKLEGRTNEQEEGQG